MTSITGTWDLVIRTPIGKQHVVLDLAETPGHRHPIQHLLEDPRQWRATGMSGGGRGG
jgi:hypothetical protein